MKRPTMQQIIGHETFFPEIMLDILKKVRGRPQFLDAHQTENPYTFHKSKSYQHLTSVGNGKVRTLVLRDVLKSLDQNKPLTLTKTQKGIQIVQRTSTTQLFYVKEITQ